MTNSNKILKNILIKNYRNFKEVKMDFAEPNGEIGSGLTVITGANNAGKTSFLEALTLQPTHHITQSQRHENELAIIERIIICCVNNKYRCNYPLPIILCYFN